MSGLRRDDELVAVSPQFRAEEPSEILLGGARFGTVVVREVEMRDPEIKRTRYETPHVRGVVIGPEVVPQPECDPREPESTPSAADIRHHVISIHSQIPLGQYYTKSASLRDSGPLNIRGPAWPRRGMPVGRQDRHPDSESDYWTSTLRVS